MTNWTNHDSTEPPALAPAAILDLGNMLARVDHTAWKKGMQYRQYRDPEGIPYCSAEGLRESTKYVSTDEDGAVFQWVNKPRPSLGSPGAWVGISHALSGENYRHTGHWKDSLMRVWRES